MNQLTTAERFDPTVTSSGTGESNSMQLNWSGEVSSLTWRHVTGKKCHCGPFLSLQCCRVAPLLTISPVGGGCLNISRQMLPRQENGVWLQIRFIIFQFFPILSNFFQFFFQFLGNNNSWLLFLWMILTLQLLIIHKLIRGQVKWTVVSLSLACLHLERLPQNVKQELCWRNCGLHFGIFIHVIVIFDRGNFTRINTVNAVPLPQQHRPEMNYHSISPINNWRIDLFDLFIGFLIYYSEVGGTLLRIVESITTRRIVLHRNRIIDRKIHRCHIHLLSHYLTD